MNRVSIKAEEVPPPAWKTGAGSYIRKILKYLKKDNWDVSVMFCGDRKIRELNLQYRKKNEATDILTFLLGESDGDRFLPGDIVVSLETLENNCTYFNVDPDEELRRLLIHGILHLDGMDHGSKKIGSKSGKKDDPMLQLQEKILAELAGERII